MDNEGFRMPQADQCLTDRRRGDRLEVPTVHYSNGQGRHITVMGLKHYASADFWQGLQAELDALPGSTVIHFEKPINDRSQWSLRTRLKAAVGDVIDASNKTVWTSGGVHFQFDNLEVRDNWQNHDAPTSRILGATSLGLLLVAAGVLTVAAANPWIARIFGRGLVRGMIANAGETQSLGALVKTSVILDERNAVAAEAAVACKGDVVMLWGHAHLPGIGTRLEQHGFQLERVSWRTLFVVGE